VAYSALNPPVATYSIDELVSKARAANPDLAVLTADVRANELNLIRSRNQTRPQLDAVASVSQRSLSTEVGESFSQIAALKYTSFFLGMNFILPLDNTLATSQLEADEIALQRAQLRLREAELMVDRQARQALRLYESQKKRAVLSAQEIELARKNLDATNLKYQGGLTSYLEVMELERTLQDAEIRAAQILVDVQLALLGVRRLTGELLTASELEQLK
jgi:outer membrane protein TolC